MSGSLQGRLLLTATAVLAAFLGLTGFALDRGFRDSAEAGVHDHLRGQLYGLLAAVDWVDDALVAPAVLPEARFALPDSGLYAQIVDHGGEILWRSDSALSQIIPASPELEAGAERFGHDAASGLYVLQVGIAWELSESDYRSLVVAVAEGEERYESQVRAFRRSLWLWLGGAAVLLVAVQWIVLRWGLRPLRQVAESLREVERGERSALGTGYPREIARLTSSIDAFIRSERNHLKRYRDTLGDLAHSLKTPLAVLQGILGPPEDKARDLAGAREQLERMSSIVEYQLRRAAASGQVTLATPAAVEPVLARVLASLRKVYADKGVEVTVTVEPGLRFFGDEGDLYEVVGNLADNAFKWCDHRVTVEAGSKPSGERPGIRLVVGDDGPGFDGEDARALLERGRRTDSTMPGQGIGLAVARDIIESYGGSLELERGPSSGARVVVVMVP